MQGPRLGTDVAYSGGCYKETFGTCSAPQLFFHGPSVTQPVLPIFYDLNLVIS